MKFSSRSHDAVIRVYDETANDSTGAIESWIHVYQDFYMVVVQEGGRAVQHRVFQHPTEIIDLPTVREIR